MEREVLPLAFVEKIAFSWNPTPDVQIHASASPDSAAAVSTPELSFNDLTPEHNTLAHSLKTQVEVIYGRVERVWVRGRIDRIPKVCEASVQSTDSIGVDSETRRCKFSNPNVSVSDRRKNENVAKRKSMDE
ncbi:uncharacterized protein [Venturia canescens]|uniref:uncharacterized protein n=1 Tax=Venturia canescens TaxID=32260 RepID=UPI001C9C993C|nr:uncharacterized protein LOC122409958 [Venturia canescens]